MSQRKRKIQEIINGDGDAAEPVISQAVKVSKIRTSGSSNAETDLAELQQNQKGGNLLSCGQNEVGQLGFDENVNEKTRPALVTLSNNDRNNIVDISAGGMHSLYLTKSGEVWSFGCNDEGALGRDTTEEGSEYESAKVNLPAECVKITAGDSHSAFLLKNKRVYACGSFRDSHGTMGLNVKGKQQFPIEVVPGEEFIDITSGADHLVMLSNKGKVFTVGCAEQGQLGRVSMRASSGETRRGKSDLLQPGLLQSTKFSIVDRIWATTYGTFVRNRANGAIFAFGLNNYNQLGIKDVKETIFVPKLTELKDVESITGGQHHALVLTKDKKCYAIGRTDYGRLGIGEQKEQVVDTLTEIKELTNIKQIACGEACSFAVSDEGKVYAWGMGSNNQLGIGSDDDQFTPTLLQGKQVLHKNVLKVSSGGQHSLFIVES